MTTWYAPAETIAERLVRLRSASDDIRNKQYDLPKGTSRIKQWLDHGSIFPIDLADDRAIAPLEEFELIQLLGEVGTPAGPLPPWVVTFQRIYRDAPLGKADGARELCGVSNLISVVEPLIQYCEQKLDRELAGLPEYANESTLRKALARTLCVSLMQRYERHLLRAMVLELNVARVNGQLKADSSTARFIEFCNQVEVPSVGLSVLEEYPVLGRVLIAETERFVDKSVRLVQRLHEDRHILYEMFGIQVDISQPPSIEMGAGDSHGGETVSILTFRDGKTLVYKPRSLMLDVEFAAFLNWINDRGDHPPLIVPKSVDRGRYGWAEFISHSGCNSRDQVERFYSRIGALAAILHCLGSIDNHMENIIAHTEHPVLIDLETIFQPRIADSPERSTADAYLQRSLPRTGLLPTGLFPEFSGVGCDPIDNREATAPAWLNQNTDEMKWGYVVPPHGYKHRAMLNGAFIDPSGFRKQVVDQFEATYTLLMKHRDSLLATDGPFARLAKAPIRIVFRPTRFYDSLLWDSQHPDALRDELKRACLWQKLAKIIDRSPVYAYLVSAERRALERGDIPYFSSFPGSRDVFTTEGECLPGVLPRTCLDEVVERLNMFSEDDRYKQSWICASSFDCISSKAHNAEVAGNPDNPLGSPLRSISDLKAKSLELAIGIGDRLDQLAVRRDNKADWMSLAIVGGSRWSLSPTSDDLYAGRAGIALFFAYLARESGQARFERLARAALEEIKTSIREAEDSGALGGFMGLGSYLYLLTHLAVLWDDVILAREINRQLEQRINDIRGSGAYDIMYGAAGLLGTLLCAHKDFPSQLLYEAATLCGDELIGGARQMNAGWGWPSLDNGGPVLTGFSHGAAGISWALHKLAVLTGEARFQAAADKGIEFERSVFLRDLGNWPDLRTTSGADGHPATMLAWCHGAPGIALGRLGMYPQGGRDLLVEIDHAMQATVEGTRLDNHSLCHGAMGNLEIMLQVSSTIGFEQWRTAAEQMAVTIVKDIERRSFLCGSGCGETPGLMLGISGIGLGLLRLRNPDRIPSVLVLEPAK